MASTQHPSTMENLVDDVLSEIFVRLLAKQLAQMRCVCKPWNALLSESSFIKFHLHHSIHKNDEILLVFGKESFSFRCEPFTAQFARTPRLKLTNFIKFPINPPSGNTIIGSVNGLICFSHKSNGYFAVNIWNPSLSAMLNLPRHSMHSHEYNHSIEIFLRFGFEPKTDNYKVVKLTAVTGPYNRYLVERKNQRVVKEWLQVEVYNMRKGSWELITQRFPSYITRIQPQDEVCVDGHDGHLHWLGYIDVEMKAQTIVAFDMGVETFREISLPDFKLDYIVHRRNMLGILAGKLCVMSSISDGKCEVWVMDKYGVAESWTKHHVFSQFSGIAPIGFTLHNEFSFYSSSGHLSLYDPIACKVKFIRSTATQNGCIKIIEYVDSLVWVVPTTTTINHGNGREISYSNISDFVNLETGISRMVNCPRETKAKALILVILFFLIITFMILFFVIRLPYRY